MQIYKLLSTWFGIGYIKGGGTLAAAFWLLLWMYVTGMPGAVLQVSVIVLLFLTGTFTASKVERDWGKDSSKVVIDEILGMAVALFLVSHGWATGLTAFVLFRFFDMVKPLGIRRLESLKGGLGVMADDLAAGIAANLLTHGLIYLEVIQ